MHLANIHTCHRSCLKGKGSEKILFKEGKQQTFKSLLGRIHWRRVAKETPLSMETSLMRQSWVPAVCTVASVTKNPTVRGPGSQSSGRRGAWERPAYNPEFVRAEEVGEHMRERTDSPVDTMTPAFLKEVGPHRKNVPSGPWTPEAQGQALGTHCHIQNCGERAARPLPRDPPSAPTVKGQFQTYAGLESMEPAVTKTTVSRQDLLLLPPQPTPHAEGQ